MKKILFALLALTLLSACGKIPEAERNVFCMDTVMNIKIYGDGCSAAAEECEKALMELDALLDRGSEASDVYTVNNGGNAVAADTENIIKAALEVSRETDGAFDITVSSVMDMWGFYDKNYTVPDDEALKNALRSVDYRNVFFNNESIRLLNNAKIDLGGIGKGYASDKICEILRRHGIASAIINLGGNVYAYGEKASRGLWRVGVADPDDSAVPILTIDVSNAAVVTSGGYQRYFESGGKVYHHIINPKTGMPADSGIKSVTVVCESGTRADALSTALFVMGKEKAEEYLERHTDVNAVIIVDDGTVYCTEALFSYVNVGDGTKKEKMNPAAR